MVKGWRTVSIDQGTLDLLKEDWEKNEVQHRKFYGIRSFNAFVNVKLMESAVYKSEFVKNDNCKFTNPLIDEGLLEDIDSYIERNYELFSKYLKIRNLKDFTEDALKVYLSIVNRHFDRIQGISK